MQGYVIVWIPNKIMTHLALLDAKEVPVGFLFSRFVSPSKRKKYITWVATGQKLFASTHKNILVCGWSLEIQSDVAKGCSFQ